MKVLQRVFLLFQVSLLSTNRNLFGLKVTYSHFKTWSNNIKVFNTIACFDEINFALLLNPILHKLLQQNAKKSFCLVSTITHCKKFTSF